MKSSNSKLSTLLVCFALSLAIFAPAEGSLLSGDILAIESGTIWRVDPTTGVETAFSSVPWGRDITASATGQIIALGTNDVYHIDAVTGAANKINSTPFPSQALGMGLAPNGDIYVAQGGSGTASRVQKVEWPDGEVSDVTTSWSNSSIPSDVFVESSTSLLVTSLSTHGGIYRVDLSTGDETALHTGTPLIGATGITSGGPLGYVVTDYHAVKVFAWDGTSNPPTVISEGGGFVDPRQSLVDADGTILVADSNEPPGGPGYIFRVDPSDGSKTIVSQGTYTPGHGVGGLDNPYSVAIYHPIPEPSALVLLATAALGFVGLRWRRLC